MPPLDYRFVWNNYNHPALVCAYDFGTLTAGGLMKNLARRTGSAYDGLINGTYTPANPLIRAKKTPCMDFDGTTNYITLANPLSGLSQATVIWWANLDATFKIIFSSGAGADYLGNIIAGGSVNNSINGGYFFTKEGIPNGTSYMFAISHQNGVYTILYLNGKQSLRSSVALSYSVNSSAFLGCFFNLSAKVDGRLDNMLFYDRALSASEIYSIWRSANPR